MRIVRAHEINIVQDIARACSVDPQYRTSTCDIVRAHVVQYLMCMQDITRACSVNIPNKHVLSRAQYCTILQINRHAISCAQYEQTNKRTNNERTNGRTKKQRTSFMTQLAANMSQISGLTFDSSSEDDNDAIVLEPPTAAAAAANLPPSIGSVWEHPLVEVIKVPLLNGLGNQKTTWKCLAPGCCKEWSGANSSKALAHGSWDNKFCLQVHVKACKGSASQAEIDLFCSLLKNRERKKTAVKRANDLISEDIVSSQGTVSDGILQKREKSRGGGSGGFAAANSSLSRNADEGTSGGRQMDVLFSFDKSTVSGCNSADLDAAIAQLVYCKALPFSFGE